MDQPDQTSIHPDPAWLDRLVDLHVLAVHGDLDAAAAAHRWLAHDVAARHVWDEVQNTCDRINARQTGE